MKESDRLFTSLIRAVEERRAEVDSEIKEKQRATERRAEELVDELQQEVAELQRRNTELEELRSSEDHLHILQVKDQRTTEVREEDSLSFSFSPCTTALSLSQRLPSLTSPPPTRDWTEIGVHPELCVETVRRALSKVDNTLKKELNILKKEGKENWIINLSIIDQ